MIYQTGGLRDIRQEGGIQALFRKSQRVSGQSATYASRKAQSLFRQNHWFEGSQVSGIDFTALLPKENVQV